MPHVTLPDVQRENIRRARAYYARALRLLVTERPYGVNLPEDHRHALRYALQQIIGHLDLRLDATLELSEEVADHAEQLHRFLQEDR